MAGEAEAAAAAAAQAAAAAAAAKSTPWHAGVDAEILGHWQNRNIDLADPKAVAIEMTKSHRAAEAKLGVPADQILKLPKDATDTAGWKAVRERLGAPAEAKDYDLSAVKRADGQAIDARLADTLRAEFHARGIAKDTAPELLKAVVKYMDDTAKSAATEREAKLSVEKATLEKNWGTNKDFNHLKAMEGARRLGITPEAVNALEGQIGYAAVMDAMRKIGQLGSEDPFVSGDRGGNVTTMEGAAARLAELKGDPSWTKRLLANDPTAKREFDELTRQMTGITERAA